MKKYVDLTDLVAGLRPGVGMAVADARLLAEAILDRCDAVDPIEEESEWERFAAVQDREALAEREREMEAALQSWNRSSTGVDDQAWRSEVMRMGLAVREPSPHHVQVMRGGKVLAEWWPSRGTTMHRQARGPRCSDSSAFLRWLRTLTG